MAGPGRHAGLLGGGEVAVCKLIPEGCPSTGLARRGMSFVKVGGCAGRSKRAAVETSPPALLPREPHFLCRRSEAPRPRGTPKGGSTPQGPEGQTARGDLLETAS